MEVSARTAAWSAAWSAVAVVLGGGAVASWMTVMAPGARFPDWPAPTLGALTVIAMYGSFACLAGIWPAPTRGLPMHVNLVAEHVGRHLRLELMNRGDAAEFQVQVISILDPMRQRFTPQSWTIPWLEDGSAEPKRILKGATQPLDFASYDIDAVHTEITAGNASACHWQFSTAGKPVGARYYHLRQLNDLEVQRFTLMLRIMNATLGSYLDLELSVGVRSSSLICEVTNRSKNSRKLESFNS